MLDDLPQRLLARLQQPLPGPDARRRMEPELSFGRHTHRPPPDARPAAVTILCYPDAGIWHIPLVLRPRTMAEHAGQICLPGGALEPGETTSAAAVRELSEELGVPPRDVRLLGELSTIHVFVSNYAVTPFLACSAARPCFVPAAREVDELLEIPLDELFGPHSSGQVRLQRQGFEFTAPSYRWRGHDIWGATAVILAELEVVWKEVSAA
jgi:8-oxo-dGTP pyrophosphatase MutT (NUDIX family)